MLTERIERTYQFWSEYGRRNADNVTLATKYHVIFSRYDDRSMTYINIQSDFGPPKRLKCQDVGITWKSLLAAFRWCQRDDQGHTLAWAEMDLQDDHDPFPLDFDGSDVIPVEKLSTDPAVTVHV